MVAGLADRYSTLVSEIKNTSLDQWKSEWVKNRILTYQTPDARPTASVNFARGQKRKRGKDGEKKEKDWREAGASKQGQLWCSRKLYCTHKVSSI